MIKKLSLLLFCAVILISCGKKADPQYEESKINNSKFRQL